MLGLGTSISSSEQTLSHAEVLYYIKNTWNFSVYSLQPEDFTESNVDSEQWSLALSKDDDTNWRVYDDFNSVDTEGGSYTTTKVLVQFMLKINSKSDTDSNKFKVWLSDSSSATNTLLKEYTNSDATGEYVLQYFLLESGSFDPSNDFIVFRDSTNTVGADFDISIKNLSIAYYGTPT